MNSLQSHPDSPPKKIHMRFSLLPRFYSPSFPVAPPKYLRLRFNNMTTGKPSEPPPPPVNVISSSDAKVNKLQQLLHSGLTTSSWDESWKQGLTPWDLGSPTPVLVHLHNTGSLPQGRALIPGCGSGHDVVAIASAQRKVVGLDVSERAIERAAQLYSGSPNADHFTFLKTDFFNWCPEELFDLIFDYTFFCAIEPNLRLLWAKKIRGLLKPDGELITLMFPIDNHKGGPPYKVSIADYEEVLHPVGFKATYIAENELAVAPRMGKEKLGRWKRSGGPSSL